MDNLITEIRSLFSTEIVDIDTVQKLLENYYSNPKDWREFVTFDPHKYTRNLVDTGNGKYNLMILCWGPGMGSSIHDHSNSHCFVKVLEGTLLETLFEWPNKCHDQEDNLPMKKLSETFYDRNSVSYMSDNLGLHRMENPSHSNPAISLHLYCPPYNKCQTFDERTSQTQEAVVLFHTSKDGEYNKRRRRISNHKTSSLSGKGKSKDVP